MNEALASLINTMPAALAIAAAFEIAFRVFRGANASTRYCARWFALWAVLALPLAKLRIEQPARAYLAVEAIEESAGPDPALTAGFAPEPQFASDSEAPVELPLDLLGPPALALWAMVSALLLLRLSAGCVWLWSMKRRARPLEWHAEDLRRLLDKSGLRRPVRLLASSEVRGPVACGFFRPVVVVPPQVAEQLGREDLEQVLLHELAHLSRRDDWALLAMRLLGALLWFHPAVIWILRRQERDCEMACDERAVQAGGEKRSYVACLARLTEMRVAGRAGLVTAGALGRRVSVSQRIESLIANAKPAAARVSRRGVAAAFLGLAALMVVAAALPRFVAAARPPVPQQAPDDEAPRDVRRKPQGLLAGLAAAGYNDLNVDEIIHLKNNGVSGEYIYDLSQAGLGRLSPDELIALHNNGIRPRFAREAARAGFSELTAKDVRDMATNGVKPAVMAEIHSLGFGPYTPAEAIRFAQHGVRPGLFRALKRSGINQAVAEEAVDATVHGLSESDIDEAREYGPKLGLLQILKLKKAGVI